MADRLLYSIKRAAESLDVSRPVVRRWITEGKLHAISVPGTQVVRIRHDDLTHFVESQTVRVEGPIRPPRRGAA